MQKELLEMFVLLVDPEFLVLRIDAHFGLDAKAYGILQAVEDKIHCDCHEYASVLLGLFVEHLQRCGRLDRLPESAHLDKIQKIY